MKDNATGVVKVTYYSSCLGNGPMIQTNKCDGLKVGTVVNFTAKIEVTVYYLQLSIEMSKYLFPLHLWVVVWLPGRSKWLASALPNLPCRHQRAFNRWLANAVWLRLRTTRQSRKSPVKFSQCNVLLMLFKYLKFRDTSQMLISVTKVAI